MTQDMVETFLMIMRYRNISAAAQQLYTSQTTVSHRLRMLEEEVGAPLFARHKGRRAVELTPAGEEFVDIAERWMALFADTQRLRNASPRRTLSIGATNLINTYVFPPLYRRMLSGHPELRLDIKTYHSGEIYRLVETRVVDIGYVWSQRSFPDVIATPLYHETMCVLRFGDSCPATLTPEDLPADREVYLRWSTDYELWHDRFWPHGQSLLAVGSCDQIPLYLNAPGNWAIVPESIALSLGDRPGLSTCEVTDSPPQLQCYELAHRYPKQSTTEALELFRGEVRSLRSRTSTD